MSEIKRVKSNIKFVNLHGSHTTFSVFDGMGFPEDHMRYAWQNGLDAMAITDHGNMNAMVYQLEAQKKLWREGKKVKNILGAELYLIPSLHKWKEEYEESQTQKKKLKEKKESSFFIENEAELKREINSKIRRVNHFLVLVQNQKGLNNLFQLISQSYQDEYFYRFPRIDFDLLERHNEGLIATNACVGGILARILWQNQEETDDKIMGLMRVPLERILSIFKDRFYGEVQWNKIPEQHRFNKMILSFSKEYNFKVISTVDSHYPSPKSWKDREVYKRLGWLGKLKEQERIPESVEELNYTLYPKNGDQLWNDYKRYSKMCGCEYDDDEIRATFELTHDIAFNEIEDFEPDKVVRLPNFVVPKGKTEDGALAEMAIIGLKSRGLDKKKEYVSRLKEEIHVIKDRGFSKYFLTMKAVVDEAEKMGLSAPGRGSSAGSLTAYVLGITQMDPLRWGLLFERFLRRDATDYPDIDFDHSSPVNLKEHLIKLWGKNTVVPISNFNTLQLRSLVKDVSKLYGIPFREANDVTSKMIFEATPRAKKAHGITAGVYVPTFDEVKKYSTTLQQYFSKYPVIEKHIDALVGQVRSISQHAGGICVGEDLNKYMPLIKSQGKIQTPWSEGQQTVMHLEPMGFIKFDVLGLASLRMMENCISQILDKTGKDSGIDAIHEFYNECLHPDVIDFNDKKVWKNVFHDGKFVGIFQCTELGMQSFVKRVRPETLEELSALTSIYRPGPLAAGVDKDYLDAKENKENIHYEHPLIKEVLGKNYGFIVYQEDLAALACTIGDNVSLDEGNMLRKLLIKKGLGKKKEDLKKRIEEKFLTGATKKGMTVEQAEKLWAKMEYFSKYGFCKAHAYSYSVLSYQCAYLLTHYPDEWTSAFLDKEPEARKEKAINLAKAYGYAIEKCDINRSGLTWTISREQKKTLIQPFTSLKGLGDKAVEQIMMHRPFNTIEELLFNEDVIYGKLNKKALDSLCRAEALNVLIDDRFVHLKHFWLACILDRPKTKKKLLENIVEYKDEPDFTEEERIENLINISGIFPVNLVMSESLLSQLNERLINPISDYNSDDGNVIWAIPREVINRKTAKGRAYYFVKCIDSNSVQTNIRCWGVRPERIDERIHVNRPYMIKVKYNDTWGFSTNGCINRSWKLLG